MPIWRPKARRRLGQSIHTGQLQIIGDSRLALAGTSIVAGPRMAFGMSAVFGTIQDTFLGSAPTPDALHGFTSTASGLLNGLAKVRARGARCIIRITHGNDNYGTPTTPFDLAAWKGDCDPFFAPATRDALRPFVRDGTLIGHYLIDEPFTDFSNFTVATLQLMALHSKASWPFVPTFVRAENSLLQARGASAGTWLAGGSGLDSGWAQYSHETGLQGTDLSYFDYITREWNIGASMGLGVMAGFNLIDGGSRSAAGCEHIGSTGVSCGLRNAEIRAVGDDLVRFGDGKVSGCIGWENAFGVSGTSAQAQRDYLLRADIQASLTYTYNKLVPSGFRPGPANVRNDIQAA